MTRPPRLLRARRLLPAAALVAAGITGAALLAPPPATADASSPVRFSTFNASLNRATAGALITDLSTPGNVQAGNVAETIQRVRPDVLLINEFDYDAAGTALRLFQDNYLSVAHNGAAPISYPYRYAAPSNTGVPSGFDLDNNGSVGGGNDAFGFGDFPGQFGMAVYSTFPIQADQVRTFAHFLWKDMPGALLPDDPATAAPADWYSPDEQDVVRLSSKSHWDLPIRIGGKTVHFLVSHPTPPVFDGPEDRNGLRNHDEIRFWADYVRLGRSAYVYDDAGAAGGLARGALFVIAGDQNSDPLDGDSVPGSTQQLLDNPRVNAKNPPRSDGAVEAAALQDAVNATHRSDPQFDTADFCDTPVFPPCSGPGNLRADYVLPSKGLQIRGSGVFWPVQADPLSRLTGPGFPVPTSDHRQVWVDVRVPGALDGRG
jgi:hypothetical protein